MKILTIGSGGREHAIVWRLSQDPEGHELYAAPGNPGMPATCVNIGVEDIDGIVKWCKENTPDMVVVGPEAPLVKGLVDALQGGASGVRGAPVLPAVFGPCAAGARMEGSKRFAKEVMAAAGVPTGAAKTFTEPKAAKEYAATLGAPVVVKADGLAAGKGVVVAMTLEEANAAIDDMLVDNKFGAAGAEVLIEEFLDGEECSILAMVDGEHAVLLPSSQDHKRVFDGDKGPNTGGMGAYSPAPVVTDEMLPEIKEKIILPVVRELKKRGITYRGILYAGLMITKSPQQKVPSSGSRINVVEFNARFGDPETEAVLPRLGGSFATALYHAATGCLKDEDIVVKDEVAATVICASEGYPGSYAKGKVIEGLGLEANPAGKSTRSPVEDTIVFQCGTKKVGDDLVTNGGRVLSVTGMGGTLREAVDNVYARVKTISFEGMFYRKDIAHRAFGRGQPPSPGFGVPRECPLS